MPTLTDRNSKLVQYLNEAYGKEKELEAPPTRSASSSTWVRRRITRDASNIASSSSGAIPSCCSDSRGRRLRR